MVKDYLIPLIEIRREHVVVNSRFIATLTPVFTVDEARAFIVRIKKEFADASHNVPAYIIGGGNTVTEFCSDDGEPAGTSGKPALAVLRGSGLGNQPPSHRNSRIERWCLGVCGYPPQLCASGIGKRLEQDR